MNLSKAEQLRLLALQSACMRYAGVEGTDYHAVIECAEEFRKYLIEGKESE